jgi:hypothetical protein
MAFKFYIDGQLTDQPVNDTALSTTIRRDQSIGGMVVTQDVRMIYNGNNDLEPGTVSGYTLLKNAFDTGTCNELVINIYDEVSSDRTDFIYAGVIKVPSVQIDEQRILASVAVQDNSFYSYINNNKSIEYNCNSVKTKNRLDITPPDVYEVDCFDSTTGIYGSSIGFKYRGHRVYDVFRFIIAAISDNKIGFESLFLQNEPELFIFDGFALINANTDPTVKTSFSKLFDEVNKIKNMAFYIDTTDQLNPILRIEDKQSLFSGVQIYDFEDIKELTSRVKTDNIYGTVRVGATDNDGGAAPFIYTFESGISYLGWREEVYTPLGQCNIDNELNLVNEYGITSNDIHNQLVGASTEDEDKMFLIECENIDTALLTADATQYPSWIGTTDVYYNQGTNNPSKLLSHNSNYQTGLTNTLQVGTNGFRAERGQDEILGLLGGVNFNNNYPGRTVDPIVFTDETTGSNYDGNNNYSITQGNYTTPLDGLYSFNVNFNIEMVNFPSSLPPASCIIGISTSPYPPIPAGNYYALGGTAWGTIFNIDIEAYTDNTYTTLITSSQKVEVLYGNQNTNIASSLTALLPIGAEVRVKIKTQSGFFVFGLLQNVASLVTTSVPLPNPYINFLQANGWIITNSCGSFPASARPAVYALTDSYFECTGAPDGGGVQIENDPRLFKDKEYEFTYSINQDDFQLIKQNPTGLFLFEKDGITRQGWIDTIKRDDWTGIANVKLIAQNAATTQ